LDQLIVVLFCRGYGMTLRDTLTLLLLGGPETKKADTLTVVLTINYEGGIKDASTIILTTFEIPILIVVLIRTSAESPTKQKQNLEFEPTVE